MVDSENQSKPVYLKVTITRVTRGGKSMRRLPFYLFVFLATLAVALPALAQRTTASIRGVVSDPDGKPVAGIKVGVTKVDTGFNRETSSNASGVYSFADLPVGTYVLSVEAEGYKSVLVQNIVLNVADIREQNIKLELGAVTDKLTVTSSAVVVETTSGEVAGLITGEQVRNLPLNGRNFLQLTQLMPGVTTLDNFNTKNKGLLTGSDVSVSGGRVTSNMWLVDGANNNDVGSNRTVLVYPSLEAVEEFKIHRNAYGAEFGGAGGAQVNLITRGGTNDLQGSVFYFLRDDSFNEANFILRQADAQKEPLSRDDYGFTLGGAFRKDKLHFFVSGEWNDETRGIARSAFVPTAAERQGDFSQSNPDCVPIPVDPLTGRPFQGNVIPQDRLSEAGLLYLQLYPLPNASISGDCTNWVEALAVPINWDQINLRGDWNVTDNVRFMVRYTEDGWDNLGPTAGDANGLWGDDPFPAVDAAWVQPSDSLVAQLNQVIGSTAINTVTYSLSGNEIGISPTGDVDLLQRINAATPAVFEDEKVADPRAHPIFWGGGGLQPLWNAGPWTNFQDLKIFKDDFEKVFGDHVVKAGVLYGDNRKLEISGGGAAGEGTAYWGSAGIGGWGATSGNIVADFLLKDMTFGFSERSFNATADQHWEDLEFYVADSWKVRPNLTIDAGIRYSRFDWPVDKNVLSLNFDPASYDPALGGDACNGLLAAPGTNPCADAGLLGGTAGPNSALINNDTDNFAPRLGLAWDVFGTGKSVLRAGFGQFYQRERLSPNLSLVGNPPFVNFTGGIRSLDGNVQFLDFVGAGRPNAGFDVNAETPYNLQYNLTWEQQIGDSSTVEVSYVASRGKHLLRSNDINHVAPGDINNNGVDDRLDFVRCGAADAGCRAQFRRFGPSFGDGTLLYWTTDGASDYDSIQTQYTLRFGRGSQFQASYTLADFDADTGMNDSSGGFNADATTLDISNPGLDWGPAIVHRDHVLNASVIYNLPSFEGAGGFREHFLGNWSVGGIVIYATGTPITVLGNNPGGDLAGTHPAAVGYEENARPLRTGASCGGGGTLQIINPAAFTFDGYQLGNTAQQSRRGQCEGPDFLQFDLSLYKQIPIGDRFNLQLRFEVFNIFNRTNVVGQSVDRNFNPGVTLDAPRGEATTVVSTGEPSPTFGRAFAVRDPRQVQLGVKLSF